MTGRAARGGGCSRPVHAEPSAATLRLAVPRPEWTRACRDGRRDHALAGDRPAASASVNPALTDRDAHAPARCRVPMSPQIESTPPQNESASMFEVSAPGFCSPAPRSGTPESALQVAAPASGRPSAAVQVPVPTLETSTSTLQLSTPTHFGATAPQNESKKAVRERVTPPATGRMTPPLPGRTRRRPPPGGGLASSCAGEIRRLRQAPECRPGVSRLPSFRAAGDPGGFDPCLFRRNDPDPSAAGMRSSPCIFRLSS